MSDDAEGFETAFEDALDPDLDGEVKLKAGDAPLKVHHQLTATERSRALIFHRQKHTKFVRDMIAVGLLPLTSDEDALEKAANYKHGARATVPARDEQLRLRDKLPMITQTLLESQRACMTADTVIAHQSCPGQSGGRVAADMALPAEGCMQEETTAPAAHWRNFAKPSEAMAKKVAEFEKSIGGFKLAQEQLCACRWFGEAMDVALQEEENSVPLRNRKQQACLLIGAGGTGKTTIVLELMLEVFCQFFPARPGEEERYIISTFSHAQSDAISNDTYRARTCHTSCSYRVTSLRNKHLALKTKEEEMKRRWTRKILVVQDDFFFGACSCRKYDALSKHASTPRRRIGSA